MRIIRLSHLKWLVFTSAFLSAYLLCSQGQQAGAGGHAPDCGEAITTIKQMKGLSACQLEQIYGQACAGEVPVGMARGRLLVLSGTRLPRVKTRMANTVWKGKQFACDGSFINQWLGFKALHSHAVIEPSWVDGQPSIVMEYPPNTPVFGNMRDEIRQIGPGLYLGVFFERCPCPKFRGFFALETECGGCGLHGK